MSRDWMMHASSGPSGRTLLAVSALVLAGALAAGVWYLRAAAPRAPTPAAPVAHAPPAAGNEVAAALPSGTGVPRPCENCTVSSEAARAGRPREERSVSSDTARAGGARHSDSVAPPPALENGQDDPNYTDQAYAPGGEPGPCTPERWAAEILVFERTDKRTPPPANAILFVGGSSIRLWHALAKDMAPAPVIQRGFGGARLADVLFYAPRIVLPYRPKAIVLYAGDNDVGAYRADERRTPQEVLADFQRFAALVHARLPDTTVYFASIKPSPQRAQHWEQAQQANQLILDFVKGKPGVGYIDVSSGLLDMDGRPRRELYGPDGLHLNAEGYKVWRRAIREALGVKEDQR